MIVFRGQLKLGKELLSFFHDDPFWALILSRLSLLR